MKNYAVAHGITITDANEFNPKVLTAEILGEFDSLEGAISCIKDADQSQYGSLLCILNAFEGVWRLHSEKHDYRD